MKKTIALLLTVFAFTAISAKTYHTPRNHKGFNRIENHTAADIHFYQSVTYAVNVVGYYEDINRITTEVKGDVLIIKSKNHFRNARPFRGHPIVEIYSPKFNRYDGMGTGHFYAKTDMKFDNPTFNCASTGGVTLANIICTTLGLLTNTANIKVGNAKVSGRHTIESKGTGKISFNGTNKDMHINNNGAGKVNGKISSQQVTITNNGAGNINIKNKDNKANNFTVTNNGAGNIRGKVNTTTFLGTNNGTGRIDMKGNANKVSTKGSNTNNVAFKNSNKPQQGGSHFKTK